LVWILALAPSLRGNQHRRTRIVLAVAVALVAGVGLGLVFSWGDAALWYRVGAQEAPTRQQVASAPLGETALALAPGTKELRQIVLAADLAESRGEAVTLGAWIWSTQPVQIIAPRIRTNVWTAPPPVWLEVGPEPTFYSVAITVPDNAPYLFCQLESAASSAAGEKGATIYYSGVVLARGPRGATSNSTPGSTPVPTFDDHKEQQGTWNGWRFKNLIRNGSAQTGAPYVRPWLERALQRYTWRSPSQLVLSMLDWERSSQLYLVMAQVMLRTFWASFGWAHISLPSIWYTVLGAVSLLCLAGAAVRAVQVWRRGTYIRGRILFLLAVAGVAVWANAVLRVHPLSVNVFVPAARYTYPVILPTALALLGGAWALAQGKRRWLRLALPGGLVVLAVFSLWTIAAYPRYRTPPLGLFLLLLLLCFPVGWVLGARENTERATHRLRGLWNHLRTWWEKQDTKRLSAYGVLILVLLAAFLVRAWHSNIGLPYMHIWDEPQIVHTAIYMLKSGDMNPHFFNYGSLLIYANMGVDALHYLYKQTQPNQADPLRGLDQLQVGPFGRWQSTGDFRWQISHPSFLQWNRMLTVLLGVGSVVAAFVLAQYVAGPWAGVAAAAFVGGQPFYATQLNSLALTDGPAVSLLMLACVLAATYVRRKRVFYLISSAAVIGMAAATKYNNVFGMIAPLCAALIVQLTAKGDPTQKSRRPPAWVWPAIPLTSVLVFVLCMPYALLDLPGFLPDVGIAVHRYSVLGHDTYGVSVLPGRMHLAIQLSNLFRHVGLVGTLVALAGLPRLARHRIGWIILILGGVALWFGTRTVVRYERTVGALYPLLAVAQGCGLVWLCTRFFDWLAARQSSRVLLRAIRVGTLALIALAGVLYMGNALRFSATVKNQVETRTLAVREVNALFQELELEQGTVGVAAELHVHPLDLRQIDTELLYRPAPTEELICGPDRYDLLVLPSNDGSQLTRQAVRALREAGVPLVELGKGKALASDGTIVNPGLLVVAPTADMERPDDCPPLSDQEPAEWPPEPLRILDWEAPIPDRHRPDEIPPQPWDAATACTEHLPWLVQEDQTATYSRLQERGQKMQLGVRGSVQTAPCRLESGTYRFQWNARLFCPGDTCPGNEYSSLEISVWAHPPGQPPERIRTRVLRVKQIWLLHYELVQVSRSLPVSVEIRWLDGPSAPHLKEGQPQVSLLLEPQVTVQQEQDLSLGRSLVAAWRTTVDRLFWR
jgi:4-amino-4-deoxy-L-arabinose transferase-like glycosyltransferase